VKAIQKQGVAADCQYWESPCRGRDSRQADGRPICLVPSESRKQAVSYMREVYASINLRVCHISYSYAGYGVFHVWRLSVVTLLVHHRLFRFPALVSIAHSPTMLVQTRSKAAAQNSPSNNSGSTSDNVADSVLQLRH
jgi:hypothetical protein